MKKALLSAVAALCLLSGSTGAQQARVEGIPLPVPVDHGGTGCMTVACTLTALGAATTAQVTALQQSLATLQGQVVGLLTGGTGTGTGAGSGTTVGVGIQAALTAANAMPPNVQFILDPAEAASTTASTSASILLDGNGGLTNYVDPINGISFATNSTNKGQLVGNAMHGKPVFRMASGDYDAFVNQSQSITDSFFAWQNSTFYFAVSINQVAEGNELIRANTSDQSKQFDVNPYNSNLGGWYVEQNTGGGNFTENLTVSSYGTPYLLEVWSDGKRLHTARNGVSTGDGNVDSVIGGFGAGGITRFEFLNNLNGDAGGILAATGVPSQVQRAAMLSVLGKYWNIPVTAPTTGPTTAIAPVAAPVAAGSVSGKYTQGVNDGIDATDYLTDATYPATNFGPITAGATPADGLVLNAGAHNMLNMTFPGSALGAATITTSAQLRQNVYVNYELGGMPYLVGEPQDSGTYGGPFYGHERTYLPDSPHDLIPVTADGLKIRSHCSGAQYQDCTRNDVRSGMIRPSVVFRPGMSIQYEYKPPTGYNAWVPFWGFSGQQLSPRSNASKDITGNAWVGANATFGGGNLFWNGGGTANDGTQIHESDWTDDFMRHDYGGCPHGGQMDTSTPNFYGTQWTVPPHMVYATTGLGWEHHGGQSADNSTSNNYECHTTFAPGSRKHIFVNWRADPNKPGDTYIDTLVDGRLINTMFIEYTTPITAYDPDGVVRQLGQVIIIGGEGVPTFNDGTSQGINPVDNDGINETATQDGGWTATVYSLKVWDANLANVDSYKQGSNVVPVTPTTVTGAALPAFTQRGTHGTLAGGGTTPVSIYGDYGCCNALVAAVTPMVNPTQAGTTTIQAYFNTSATGNASQGLVLMNSSSPEYFGVPAGNNGQMAVCQWASSAQYTSCVSDGTPAVSFPTDTFIQSCFRDVNTGSAHAFYFSLTCKQGTFSLIAQPQSYSAANNPDQIGLFLNPQVNNQGGGMTEVLTNYEHTTSTDPQVASF